MHQTVPLWLLLGSAVGQSTFVVDANAGPGTQFTSIQTAVTAVPDGSILLVRAGTYSHVDINGKGLTILCDPNVTAGAVASTSHFLTIRNTLPQQTVTVRALDRYVSNLHGLRVSSALGPVTYEGVGASWHGPQVSISDSPQVAIRNVDVASLPGALVINSAVVFEDCVVRGIDAIPPFSKAGGYPSHPGMVVQNSSVQIVHTSVYGGNGTTNLPASPAIQMFAASSLRAMGLASHQIAGGTDPLPGGQRPGIAGSGVARVEPAMVLAGTPPTTGVTLTRPTMPSLLSDSAAPGGSLILRRYGPVNVLCAVAISLRAPITTAIAGLDPLWLDAPSLVVEFAGPTPTTGPLLLQKSVPNQPALRGFQFVWQAADLTTAGLAAISNASPSFVR